jgi:hypothetical protein
MSRQREQDSTLPCIGEINFQQCNAIFPCLSLYVSPHHKSISFVECQYSQCGISLRYSHSSAHIASVVHS